MFLPGGDRGAEGQRGKGRVSDRPGILINDGEFEDLRFEIFTRLPDTGIRVFFCRYWLLGGRSRWRLSRRVGRHWGRVASVCEDMGGRRRGDGSNEEVTCLSVRNLVRTAAIIILPGSLADSWPLIFVHASMVFASEEGYEKVTRKSRVGVPPT